MLESSNWEAAENERELQRARDQQIHERHVHQRHEAASRAEQTRQALQQSRDEHAAAVARSAHESKEYSDDCRRQFTHAREAFLEKARAIPRTQDNQARVRRQCDKLRETRASAVAVQTAVQRAAEMDWHVERDEMRARTRARADEHRRAHAARLRSASTRQQLQREGDVDVARELAFVRESEREHQRQAALARNRHTHDGVSSLSGPEQVRRQERARKAEKIAHHKAESEAIEVALEARRREEDARKRALHDGVRRAATGGFGDRRRTAYSDYRHSGTSLLSHSRGDGRHSFRHELPSARSPAGRWLRDYASAYIQARDSARSSPTSGLSSAGSSPVVVMQVV